MKSVKTWFAIIVLAALGTNIGLNLRTIEHIRYQTEDPSSVEMGIMSQINAMHFQGHQERTVLMERVLGLEHIHGMHAGTHIEMCEGCRSNKRRESETQGESVTLSK
tara:strand:+ start:653 stop:973 length:321 start_codon:yes stop_codon:yes gene_type:complete